MQARLSSKSQTLTHCASPLKVQRFFSVCDADTDVQMDLIAHSSIATLLEKFQSEKDEKVTSLLSKLNLLQHFKENIDSKACRTKDPFLDLSVQIVSLYGIRLNIFYQDRNIQNALIKGIQDQHVLHNFLRDLILILCVFPCEFLLKLKLGCLNICQDIIYPDNIKETAPVTDAVFINQHYTSPEALKAHILNIIFINFIEYIPVANQARLNREHEAVKNYFKAFVYLVSNPDDSSVEENELNNEILDIKQAVHCFV